MRSTQKQINKMLDELKIELNISSRDKASVWFFSVLNKRYKSFGYSITYYKDGCYMATKDGLEYYVIPFDYLFMPNHVCKTLKDVSRKEYLEAGSLVIFP